MPSCNLIYTIMCLAVAFFINAMKVNFSPSQITTIFKRTKIELMRVHFTSLIFTKYLPPIWNSLVLPQHLLTIWFMYKHMFSVLQFSYKRLWPPLKIRKVLNVARLNCEAFLTSSQEYCALIMCPNLVRHQASTQRKKLLSLASHFSK